MRLLGRLWEDFGNWNDRLESRNDLMESELPMHRSKRCGAKTRSGSSCQSPAMPNGRCRLHRGRSQGPPFGNKNALKHGRYTAEAIPLPKALRVACRNPLQRPLRHFARPQPEDFPIERRPAPPERVVRCMLRRDATPLLRSITRQCYALFRPVPTRGPVVSMAYAYWAATRLARSIALLPCRVPASLFPRA
jgi:hypothetical protein